MGAMLHFTEMLQTWYGPPILIVIGLVIWYFYKWMMGDPPEEKESDSK